MRKHVPSIFVLAAAILLAGCGGTAAVDTASGTGGAPADTPAATAAPADEAQSKVLVIGSSGDIVTLDPADQTNTGGLFDSIGSKLFTRDRDFRLAGDLCTKYTRVDDLTWEFKLREDALFANGIPITARDVQWSLTRAATDEGLAAHADYSCIDRVDAVSDFTVQVVTTSPRPDLLSLLAMPGAVILPADYIEDNGMDAYTASPVCSGPYLLKEWVPGDHYTLVPNPFYYGAEKAAWDEVIYRVIPEPAARVSALLNGDVDITDNVAVDEWNRVSGSIEDGGASLVYGETSRVMLMILRLTDGFACSDPAVREAIECAIDKDAICNTLLMGTGTPTRTLVASSVRGCNSDLVGSENGNLYDPERARQILADAGYAEGDLVLDMTASNDRYSVEAEMARRIAGCLEAVGIQVNLELVDSAALSQRFAHKENKDILLIGLSDGQYDGCYPLARFCDPARTAGMSDYENPEAAEMLRQARAEADLTKKAALSAELQSIAAEDRPQIVICQMQAVFGVSSRVVFNGRMDTCIRPDEVSPSD